MTGAVPPWIHDIDIENKFLNFVSHQMLLQSVVYLQFQIVEWRYECLILRTALL